MLFYLQQQSVKARSYTKSYIQFPPKTRTWTRILEVSSSAIKLVGVKTTKRQGGFEPHNVDLQSNSKPFTNLSLYIKKIILF